MHLEFDNNNNLHKITARFPNQSFVILCTDQEWDYVITEMKIGDMFRVHAWVDKKLRKFNDMQPQIHEESKNERDKNT